MKSDRLFDAMKTVLAATMLLAWAFWTPGCSKQPPPETPPMATPPTPIAPSPGSNLPITAAPQPALPVTSPTNPLVTPSNSNAAPAPSAAAPEKVQRVATLESKYRATQGFDNRFDALLAIAKEGGPEAVLALERLFRTEPDGDLRTELINALIDLGGCKEEKLALLKLGVAPNQEVSVREAAMDGLVDLEDARALPILKELTQDPNDQVRAVAQHCHQLLTEMLKAP
jgi:hypothetical protein